MNPKKAHVNSILNQVDHCLVIPPYQRPYEWNRIRWQGLVVDIMELAKSGLSNQHFIGVAITAYDKPECSFAKVPYLHAHTDLIDGQQRLITLRVWLQAVLDYAAELSKEKFENELSFANLQVQESDRSDWEIVQAGKWRENYRNFKPDQSGILHAYTYFRWILWLGENALSLDEPEALPKLKSPSEFDSNKIYDFWKLAVQKRQESSVTASDYDSNLQVKRSKTPDWKSLIASTLQQLYLVVIEREASDEDAAELFNALNGKRTELREFDHIRNFIFASIKDQSMRDKLYRNTWKYAEQTVRQEKITVRGSSALDTFVYDYLIAIGEKKYQNNISKDKTAIHFVRYFNSNRNKYDSYSLAEQELIPYLICWTLAKRYGESIQVNNKKYSLPKKSQNSLKLIEWLSSGPVTPLILHLIKQNLFGRMTQIDLQKGLSAIENFLARKVLSGQPLSPLRTVIMEMCAQLGDDWKIPQLLSALDAIKPTDYELRRALLVRRVNGHYEDSAEMYVRLRPRQILAIFQGIETELSGELTDLLRDELSDGLSVDHIFPQRPDKWKVDLGNWDVDGEHMKNRLHTFGNLAVVPKKLNNEMSNKKFEDKRTTLKKHKFVKLRINDEWLKSANKKWTPDLVDERAAELFRIFVQHWPQKSKR